MSETKPNLLVISQTFPPEKGGNASRMHDLMRHLTDEWKVTVIAPPKCYPHGEYDWSWTWYDRKEVDGIQLHRVWAWQPTNPDPSFASRIAYYLTFALHAFVWVLFNFREYDVVFTSSPPIFTGFVAFPFGYLTETPWVVDIRDMWIDLSVNLGFISDGGLIERISRKYRQLELSTCDLITVTTRETEASLVSQYGISTPIGFIPNGVETELFKPGTDDPDPTVIYTGTIGHCQDLESCVKAMQYVSDDMVSFHIVGGGDLRAKLERMSADLGIEERIKFKGFVERDRIPEFLADSMIGIAPIKPDESLQYAVPTKLYEYMAGELPVIAVGKGEIKRFVKESEGGLVADNDPKDIAEKIDTLVADRAYRGELGRNGRKHIEAHYDREAIAHRLSDYFTAVSTGTPLPTTDTDPASQEVAAE